MINSIRFAPQSVLYALSFQALLAGCTADATMQESQSQLEEPSAAYEHVRDAGQAIATAPSMMTAPASEHELPAPQLARTPPPLAAAAGAPSVAAPAPAVAQATSTASDAGFQEVEAREEHLWPADCDEHFVFHAHGRASDPDPSKYTIPAGNERVATFYFKAPWSQPAAQLLQSRERIDNHNMIHHWMLYLVDNDEHPDGDILDDYKFQSLNTLLNQQSLVGGIPGGGDMTLPDDVGLRLPDNEQTYALSIHYLNATDAPQLDASGIEVCVTSRARPHEAATHWLGTSSITLPPRTQTRVSGTCSPTEVKEPVHILSANPHMHRLGTHANLDLLRASGETVSLLDVPYAFDEQKIYDITTRHAPAELLLHSGDRLLTTCTFDNTTDRVVAGGEQSADEMCLVGVVAWPAGSLANGNLLAGFNGLSVDQACVDP